MRKLIEKFCLWYLKAYWNSKTYKAEQAKVLSALSKKNLETPAYFLKTIKPWRLNNE